MYKGWMRIFFVLGLVGLAACSGGSNPETPIADKQPSSNAGALTQNSPPKALEPEKTDDTLSRLENLALRTGTPKDDVLKAWQKFGEFSGFTSLNDLDVSKEEDLLALYNKFLGRADPALRFITHKIMTDPDCMLARFGEEYKKLLDGSFANQDEFETKFNEHFRETLLDLRPATQIFGREIVDDLNTLFPGRFVIKFGLKKCDSALCEGFVARSLQFLDSHSNSTFFKNYDLGGGKNAHQLMEEFFAAFFNNTILIVGDKTFAFVHSDTGLESLKPDYTLKDSF